jgi:hypothetical protein
MNMKELLASFYCKYNNSSFHKSYLTPEWAIFSLVPFNISTTDTSSFQKKNLTGHKSYLTPSEQIFSYIIF